MLLNTLTEYSGTVKRVARASDGIDGEEENRIHEKMNVKYYDCRNGTRKEGEKMCTAMTSRSINAEGDLFIFKFFFRRY